MTMAVTEQGDAITDKGESSGDMAYKSHKRGQKKLVGSKKLQVSVTDVNQNPGISNGASLQDNSVKTPRGRGRPKGSKNIIDNKTPKKRGRPKGSTNKSASVKGDVGDLPNDSLPKKPRGRPKGSTKRKLDSTTSGDESDGSSSPPQKRDRPKGSPNKKPKLRTEVDRENEVETTPDKPKKGRGRPRKN